MSTEDDKLFTTEGLAEYLSVEKSTVYTWKTKKIGPPSVGAGRLVRYRKSDVDAWLEARAHEEKPHAS